MTLQALLRSPRAVLLGLALLPALAGPTAAQCDEKLVGSSAPSDDHFAESFDVDGQRAVVAAPRDGDAGHWAGAAHVFEKVQGQWQLEQKLVPTDLPPGGLFSHAQVAIDDDWIFAGSQWEPTPDLNGDRGVVRIYRREATGWVPFQTVWHPGTGASSSFAARIEVDGDRLIVAARGLQTLFVYRFDGTAWVETQAIGDPEPTAPGNWLGVDISAEDGRVATSVVRELDGDGVPGNFPAKLVAYVFAIDGPTDSYALEARLDFAQSKAILPGVIALGDDRVAVQGIVTPENQTSSLHVFDLTGGVQTFSDLLPPDGLDVDFARALAFIDDDILAVGSRGISPKGLLGKVITYRQTALGWLAESEFRPLQPTSDQRFGTALRGTDDEVYVSSESHDPSGAISGRVDEYERLVKPSLDVDAPSISTSTGGVQTLTLSSCAAYAGKTYVILGSLALPPGDGGLPLDDVHVQLSVDAWFDASLDQANGGVFGSSVGLLDASGSAVVQITVPATVASALAGVEFFHAGVIVDVPGSGLAVAASVPSRLTLTP